MMLLTIFIDNSLLLIVTMMVEHPVQSHVNLLVMMHLCTCKFPLITLERAA